METIDKLIKFITEDPIMLGLCLAIVVLIIAFILVLIFGGKKEKKKEKIIEESIDNTRELLKPIIEEPLRSTQELNLNLDANKEPEIAENQSLENIQLLDEAPMEENIPITVNDAIELKNQREQEELKDTIEIPVIYNSDPTPVEIPNMQESEDKPVEEEPIVQIPKIEQPLSPIYTTPETKPEMENTVTTTVDSDQIPIEQAADDLDLPKLKKEPESSIFDTLSGESFNINK